MDDEFIKSMCIRDVLRIDYSVTFSLEWGTTYESIVFPEGYEKPPKDEFEAKLQERIDAQPLKELRTERNTLLTKTDKYTIPDWPHSSLAKQTEWIEYRQALRNLPSVTEDPANPVWPVRPDEVVAVVVKEETSNVVVKEETSNVVVEEETSNVVVKEETSNVVVKEETSNVVVKEETSNVVVKEETSNVVAVPTA